MTPALSILIVTYNSRADLERCLPTIWAQSFTDLEVIVVDNHGGDGVAEWLQTHHPAVRLFRNPVNSGYAGGNNLGLRQARGRWVLLLNPDTELRPGCLDTLMQTARAHPDAFITPKLLNGDGRTINACGNVMHYTGITTCRGLNQPADTYRGLEPVPLLSGAALLAPLTGLRQLNGFDERYFMYFEDTDMSLRARQQGIPLWCQADAEIVHHYTLRLSPGKFYYLERNRLLTLLKLFSGATLRALLPALLLTELATWAYALRGPAYLRARWRGYVYLWRQYGNLREESRQLRQIARQPDWHLLHGSLVTLPMGQVAPGRIGQWLGAVMTRLYAWLRPAALR